MEDSFYNEETRLDYRVSREMKEVWATSMELAEKLVSVCQKNGLKCWMDSGTLLGSVRHKGFIPWDDDIDFVMLRKDYDKLVKIADQEFTYPYFFQTAYSDKDYYKGHAQLRDMRTSSLSMSELKRDYCRGIDVDIFVLDGFIENVFLRFLHRTATMIVKKSIKAYLNKNNRSVGKKIGHAVCTAIYSIVPYRKAFGLYESFFRMVDSDKSKRVSVISYKYSTRKKIRNRSSYDETVWLDFENTRFPAPKDTNDALVCYFGKDYMTPLHLTTAHGRKYMNAKLNYEEAAKLLTKNPDEYERRIALLYTD